MGEIPMKPLEKDSKPVLIAQVDKAHQEVLNAMKQALTTDTKITPVVEKKNEKSLDMYMHKNAEGNMVATDLGRVKSMVLPAGWVGDPESREESPASFLKTFHPPDDSKATLHQSDDSIGKATLTFLDRGNRIDGESGNAFHKLLQQSPHILSDAERVSIDKVLGSRLHSGDFDLEQAKFITYNLNNRNVLMVQGHYQGYGLDVLNVFYDADPKDKERPGTIVGEMFFQAPTGEFNHHRPEIETALKTIEWK